MKSNKYADVFSEQGNLLTLTGIVAASAVLLNPLPLLVGAVAETAYLLFVPDSRWYQSRLRDRKEVAVKARREGLRSQVFDVVDRQTWARYEHLETIRNQIGAQTKKEEKWYVEVTSKLDYLLEKFLTFAAKEVEYRTYLTDLWREDTAESHEAVLSKSKNNLGLKIVSQVKGHIEPDSDRVSEIVGEVQARFDHEVKELEDRAEVEVDKDTKAVLLKRIDVLKQRCDGVAKIGRILTNLRFQLDLVEDTFGLINDQIRARSPEQVLSDIEGVVYQADAMTTMLEELTPYSEIAV